MSDQKTVQERLVEQHGDEYKASKEASEEFMKSVSTDEYGLQMMDGNPDPIPRFHSGSIRIDEVLGGGVPVGRIIESFGPPSSGKTSLASHMIAEMQKRGRGTLFIDAEHALDPEYAEEIGVNMSALALAQPDSGEQALNLCEKAIRSGHYGLVVVDSVSALTPEAELEGDMGDDSVGLQARMMSQHMRKIRAATQPNNCTVLFTNQVRSTIGGWGNNETTSGGRALRFYASVRLRLQYTGQVKDGDKIIGNSVRVYCKKNKTAPPFKKAETMITFEESSLQKGINRNKEILDIAVEAGVIKKAGSWYKLMRDDEEHARYWEGIGAGLDPEGDDFEEDVQDIPIDEDDMEKTIAQGEAAMLEALSEDAGLYEEVMNRALDWYRGDE